MTTTLRMHLKKPTFHSPRDELLALLTTFVPRPGNNDTRKLVTLLVVGTWLGVFVLQSLGYANPPEEFDTLGYIIMLFLGKMWEIEVEQRTSGGSEE